MQENASLELHRSPAPQLVVLSTYIGKSVRSCLVSCLKTYLSFDVSYIRRTCLACLKCHLLGLQSHLADVPVPTRPRHFDDTVVVPQVSRGQRVQVGVLAIHEHGRGQTKKSDEPDAAQHQHQHGSESTAMRWIASLGRSLLCSKSRKFGELSVSCQLDYKHVQNLSHRDAEATIRRIWWVAPRR